MRRLVFAGTIGAAMLLAACGGSSTETPTSETSESAAIAPTEATDTLSTGASPAGAEESAPAASESASTASVAAAVTPPAAFNQCKVCHEVEPGKHGIGPSLAGIYGTKAGDIAGFEFSTAMKDSGLTWDAATLDKYLTDPRGLVPGTKMSFGGLKDEAKRKEIIDYLKAL